MNIAICVQYHEADKFQADRLIRMICDIEPTRRDDVELVIVRRFDATPMIDTMVYAADKFTVSAFTTHTRWTGWPAGPNGVALDVLNDAATRVKNEDWNIGALILLEPDCVPVSPAWIDQLKDEWEVALADGKLIMGAWRDSGGPLGHINGNCVVRPNIAAHLDLSVITPHLAWDCALAPQLRNHWMKTGLVRNLFQETNVTRERMLGMGDDDTMPVLVHGIKDTSGVNIAKHMLGL